MVGYGCGGAAEIIPVIGKSQVQKKISRQAKAVSVLEFVLEFALLTETAAMIQIALEDVPGINLEKIERDGLFRLFGGGDGGVFPSASVPAQALMSDEESAAEGGEAKEVFHNRVRLFWLNRIGHTNGFASRKKSIRSVGENGRRF